MKYRPIIFSGESIRAILDGCKTQTRRVVKPKPQLLNGSFEFSDWPEEGVYLALTPSGKFGLTDPPWYRCPYGVPGDRLWVREGWCHGPYYEQDGIDILYRADDKLPGPTWRSPIFMPREFSRITLGITNIKVERVQDISEEDALAEGALYWWNNLPQITKEEIYDGSCGPAGAYGQMWDIINKKRGHGWDKNPWVWCVEFKIK